MHCLNLHEKLVRNIQVSRACGIAISVLKYKMVNIHHEYNIVSVYLVLGIFWTSYAFLVIN